MFAGTGFGDPPSSLPRTANGLVVQITYGPDTTGAGKLWPFNPDDPDMDLVYRGWENVMFSTHSKSASEIYESQLAYGWRSRILPGVAEQVGEVWILHTLH